jgi:hypothetical protein
MVPTPTPKPTPKPKPTAVPARTTPKTPVSTPPILGTDLSIFTAKYGKPNDHSTASTGSYHYQRYSGSNIDFLILQTDLVDAGYDQKVEWVTVNASDRGNGWTTQQADTTCAPFFPSDAVYKSQVPLSNGGYDKIYYSASLAHLFPAPAFTDANTNQVKAGTFDVEYITQSGSGSNIGACSILIGTQQTQN